MTAYRHDRNNYYPSINHNSFNGNSKFTENSSDIYKSNTQWTVRSKQIKYVPPIFPWLRKNIPTTHNQNSETLPRYDSYIEGNDFPRKRFRITESFVKPDVPAKVSKIVREDVKRIPSKRNEYKVKKKEKKHDSNTKSKTTENPKKFINKSERKPKLPEYSRDRSAEKAKKSEASKRNVRHSIDKAKQPEHSKETRKVKETRDVNRKSDSKQKHSDSRNSKENNTEQNSKMPEPKNKRTLINVSNILEKKTDNNNEPGIGQKTNSEHRNSKEKLLKNAMKIICEVKSANLKKMSDSNGEIDIAKKSSDNRKKQNNLNTICDIKNLNEEQINDFLDDILMSIDDICDIVSGDPTASNLAADSNEENSKQNGFKMELAKSEKTSNETSANPIMNQDPAFIGHSIKCKLQESESNLVELKAISKEHNSNQQQEKSNGAVSKKIFEEPASNRDHVVATKETSKEIDLKQQKSSTSISKINSKESDSRQIKSKVHSVETISKQEKSKTSTSKLYTTDSDYKRESSDSTVPKAVSKIPRYKQRALKSNTTTSPKVDSKDVGSKQHQQKSPTITAKLTTKGIDSKQKQSTSSPKTADDSVSHSAKVSKGTKKTRSEKYLMNELQKRLDFTSTADEDTSCYNIQWHDLPHSIQTFVDNYRRCNNPRGVQIISKQLGSTTFTIKLLNNCHEWIKETKFMNIYTKIVPSENWTTEIQDYIKRMKSHLNSKRDTFYKRFNRIDYKIEFLENSVFVTMNPETVG